LQWPRWMGRKVDLLLTFQKCVFRGSVESTRPICACTRTMCSIDSNLRFLRISLLPNRTRSRIYKRRFLLLTDRDATGRWLTWIPESRCEVKWPWNLRLNRPFRRPRTIYRPSFLAWTLNLSARVCRHPGGVETLTNCDRWILGI